MFVQTAVLIFATHLAYFNCHNFHQDNECDIAEEDTMKVEFYKKDDSLFILVSERVAWFEASSVCQYYEADLSTVNYTAKADFIAHFLAESNFRSEDFWLGGRYVKGQWMWMDGQLVNNSKTAVPGSWKQNPKGKECLAMERSKHYTPIFAALSCHLLKPFICERSLTTRTKKPLPSLPVQTKKVNNSIFTLYHSRISWDKALAFCRTIGQRLAVVPNNYVVKSLRTEMLRTRPHMENAWVGGYYHENSWVWVPTGVKIPNVKQEDQYPPWLNEKSGRLTKGCILFDRHFTDAYFVPTRCNRRKDFICEQYIHTPDPAETENDTIFCNHNSITMYIYMINKNWTEAETFCYNQNLILAEPSDYDTVKAIAICLGDHSAEPRHAWLGGRFKDDSWHWVTSKKEIKNNLPWCEEQFENNSPCLNLDRTDHDRPWVYGLQCRRRQPFVCVEGKRNDTECIETTTPSTTTSVCICPCEQPAIPMTYKNKTFVAFNFNIEYKDSSNDCLYFGGIPFETSHTKDTQSYVLSYIRLSIDQCNCCTEDMIDFWVHEKTKNVCPAINLGSNKITEAGNCNSKKPFICQTFCQTPNIPANENATLRCDWMKAAGKFPYASCKFACGYDYTLFGPDRFTCDNYGWQMYTVRDRTVFRFPECHKTKETPKELINILREIQSEGVYFAIKENQKMDYIAWIAVLQFVMGIIQVFPISNNYFFGLLTFSNMVNIRIPYKTTDSCTVLKQIRDLNITKSAQNTYYNVVFSELQNELLKNKRKTLIFFIVDKENAGLDYETLVRQIHEDNTIFVIGITDGKFIFDLDMVASVSRYYRLYSMKVIDYKALTDVALKLLEYRSLNINCANSLYVMPALTSKVEDLKQIHKPDIDTILADATFYVIKNYVSYKEAIHQCRSKFGGNLITDYTASKLFNRTNLKRFHIDRFWIQRDSQCVVALVYSQEFQSSNCYTKYPFICEIDCSYLPPINEEDELENMDDQPHTFDCYKNDEILWGPPDLHCNKSNGGWITLGHRISPFPKCLKSSIFIQKLLQTLSVKRNDNRAGILFVLDESKSMRKEHFQTLLKFVQAIAKVYPASENLPYGLLTVNKDAKVRLPYQVTDSCDFIKSLSSIELNAVGEINYTAAIQLIDRQIHRYRQEQANVVYFLTAGLFTGELLYVKSNVANLLRWDVEIFVFKIGQYDSDVTPEIPTRDNEYYLNLFNIPSFSFFSDLVDKLSEDVRWPAVKC